MSIYSGSDTDYEEIALRISAWLNKKIHSAGKTGGVFGLSGGIDSAVTAALCKRAFGDNCLAVLMPCHSSPDDLKDARLVAEHLGIETVEVDLSASFDAFYSAVSGDQEEKGGKDPAVFNIKPRLRMTTLYYFAQKKNYLVIGTGNKSEIVMGYFTKYGDGGVDVEPIGDLTKTQVREIAQHLGLPRSIIDRIPTAGLYSGQTDETEMGMTYEALDKIIACLEKGVVPQCDNKLYDKVKSVMRRMEHKTQAPPIYKIEQETW